MALGLVLVYKYKKTINRSNLIKTSYIDFKNLANPSGTFLVSDVPGATVF